MAQEETEIDLIKEACKITFLRDDKQRLERGYTQKQINEARAYLKLKVEQYATTNINDIISQIN